MSKRQVIGLVTAVLLVGGSAAWSETASPVSRQVNVVSVLPSRDFAPTPSPAEAAVSWQMVALERRARVDMILYAGEFASRDPAQPLGAIAMRLRAGH